MKTTMRYFIAVSVIIAIGFISSQAVSAAEQPIWHNFLNETTLSGTAPGAVHLTNTAPIWQAQVDTVQKSSLPERAHRQASPVALALTTPIWSEQCKCL